MMQISFFDLHPDVLGQSIITKEKKKAGNIIDIEKKRKVGRPYKEEVEERMRPKLYPVPDVDQYVFIKQTVKDTYGPRKEWEGQVLDKTSNLVLIMLENGFRECFQIKEFRCGLLSFKAVN